MKLNKTTFETLQIRKKVNIASNLYFTKTSHRRGKWSLRYQLNGRIREMGLGSYPFVDQLKASERAVGALKLLSDGLDPIAEKNEIQKQEKIARDRRFSAVAQDYIDIHKVKWTNPKHAYDWQSSVFRLASPILDTKPFSELNTDDLLNVLRPIWIEKHETARKLQGRLQMIFASAITEGLHSGPNPAAWKEHLMHYFPHNPNLHEKQHHRALSYLRLPVFYDELLKFEVPSAKALQFTILTAARTTEALEITREEIDFKQQLWKVPARRMKARRPHTVPLSTQALDLIENCAISQNSKYLFQSSHPEKPLSNMAMLTLLKRSFREFDTTVHGFRTTFRTWAAEKTDYKDNLVEFALAHQLDQKVEGAYQRSELIDRRKPLMQDWANFVYSKIN
jgi:integrase